MALRRGTLYYRGSEDTIAIISRPKESLKCRKNMGSEINLSI